MLPAAGLLTRWKAMGLQGKEWNHVRGKEKRKDNADEKAAETAAGKEAANAAEKPEQKREVKFIENPLPLPKKHEKRVMDYKLNSDKDLGGYDVLVADDDDFDH